MDIIVFTDGACQKNGTKFAKAGIGIYYPYKNLPNKSEKFLIKPITNQRAELYAIQTALQDIISNLKFKNIILYTDSEYSINSLTNWIKNWEKNNWKTAKKQPVKNLDIIIPINNILKKYPDKIIFHHVKSHSKKTDFNSVNNNHADYLAVQAINKI